MHFSSLRFPPFLVAFLLTALVAAYLWQWHTMPLYPDEVAFRIQTTRTEADHGIRYGLYPLCISNAKPIPFMLRPAAYGFGLLGNLNQWRGVRAMPAFCLLFFLASFFCLPKRFGYGNLPVLASGFIGVAGSGLILSRPESILLLHAGTCVLTYAYLSSANKHSAVRSACIVILNLYVSLLSVYAHLQGFFLAPVTFLLLARLPALHLKKFVIPSLLALAVYFSFLLYAAYGFYAFLCPEVPDNALDQSLATLPAHIAAGENLLGILKEHFQLYIDRVLFTPNYQGNYLPGITSDKYAFYANLLDPWLKFCCGFNACVVFTLAVRASCRFIRTLRGAGSLTGLAALMAGDTALLAYAAWAWTLLFFYDYAVNFYRAFCMNLLAAALVFFAARATASLKLLIPIRDRIGIGIAAESSDSAPRSERKAIDRLQKGIRWGWRCYGLMACVLCLFSGMMCGYYFKPVLDADYAGPSIPLSTRWKGVNASIRQLARQCGLSPTASDIIIDDYTYDAARHYNHIMPVSYFFARHYILYHDAGDLTRHDAGAKAERMEIVKRVARGMLVRCNVMDLFGVPVDYRQNDVCCSRFLP